MNTANNSNFFDGEPSIHHTRYYNEMAAELAANTERTRQLQQAAESGYLAVGQTTFIETQPGIVIA